jgi:sodium transport system permease protein
MWTVLKKELLEMLREKRTLIFTFLLPTVVIPLLGIAFAGLAGYKTGQEAERVLKYAVIGIESAPELDARLKATSRLERVMLAANGSVDDAVKNGSVNFALVVPPGFEQALAAGQSMKLELHYNDAVTIDTIARRMRLLSTAYGAEFRQRFLAAHAIDPAAQHFVAEPITVTVKSTANEREKSGELIGAFLPYVFLMLGFSASLSVAVDMGAGEKERGTLESLLLLPLPRNRLVIAKFFAVALLGTLAAFIGLASLVLWGLGLMQGGAGASIERVLHGLAPADLALVALMILPANAITASLLLAISFYARSYREGANYASALLLLLVGPILVTLLPNVHLHGVWAWVPITNITLAVKEILKGTIELGDFAVVLFSTALVAGGLLWLCTEWCKRESVLFR